jgi:hypothetical protein
MIQPKSASEQLLFSTVRIETNTGMGTGFFFRFKVDDQRIIPVVITNKHVVKGSATGRFFVYQGVEDNGVTVPSENSYPIEFNQFEQRWFNHPDPDIDLCAMPFAPINEQAKQIGKPLYRVELDENLIWSDKQLDDLSAVEEVLMIGYPIGLWDNVNNLPIVRRGITATHPAINFEGKNIGITDIACFPGSSGSPIMIVNEGIYVNKGGATVIGSRALFLGVLFAGPTFSAEGTIMTQAIPTISKSFSVTSLMIHLGYFVKAKEIIVLGDHLRKTLHP